LRCQETAVSFQLSAISFQLSAISSSQPED
jgi:hypothetical protein